jgi:hypothetical protein
MGDDVCAVETTKAGAAAAAAGCAPDLMTVGVLGVLASMAGLIGVGGKAAAQQKASQVAAKYQTGPKGEQRCSIRLNFQPPKECRFVDRPIVPQGWCDFLLDAKEQDGELYRNLVRRRGREAATTSVVRSIHPPRNRGSRVALGDLRGDLSSFRTFARRAAPGNV